MVFLNQWVLKKPPELHWPPIFLPLKHSMVSWCVMACAYLDLAGSASVVPIHNLKVGLCNSAVSSKVASACWSDVTTQVWHCGQSGSCWLICQCRWGPWAVLWNRAIEAVVQRDLLAKPSQPSHLSAFWRSGSCWYAHRCIGCHTAMPHQWKPLIAAATFGPRFSGTLASSMSQNITSGLHIHSLRVRLHHLQQTQNAL